MTSTAPRPADVDPLEGVDDGAVGAPRRRGIARVLLDSGAVLGVVCAVLAVLALVLDVRLLVFRSGSMSPDIRTGALAVAREIPAADLRIGDVVSVHDARGVRVTHRIVSIGGGGPVRQLRLRGDANRRPDAEVYPVTSADRVVAHVEGVGYVLGRLSGPIGVYGGGVLSGLLLALAFGRRPGERPARRRGTRRDVAARRARTRDRARTGTAVLLALAVGSAGAAAVAPRATSASFNDVARATSSFAALTVPTVGQPSCAPASDGITLSWPTVGAAYSYQLLVQDAGGVTRATANVDATSAPTQSAKFTNGLALGLTLGTPYRVRVVARLAGATSWTAPPSRYQGVTLVAVLVLATWGCATGTGSQGP